MTARLQRRNYGRGHGYKLDGQKIIGVTTVLGAKAKNALVQWAADETAKAAVNQWDELAQLDPIDRYKRLTKARYETQTAAAVRGTDIHTYGEALAHGRPVKVPDELVGPVEGYARFLDEWDIAITATEAPCVNTRWRYAGTLDAVGQIGRIGVSALIDLKSGKSVYNETALQLAAYRYCNLWHPGGAPDSEEPMPVLEEVFVAHISPAETRLIPVQAGEAEHQQFLYTLQVALWDKEVADDSPIGAALRPEDYPLETDNDE